MSKNIFAKGQQVSGKSSLTIRAKSKDKAEIILYGAIGDNPWDDTSVGAKQFSDALKEIGDVKSIDLRINSPGGDVFDGIAIFSRIKQHPAKFTVYIDGIAASIATVIALAGDEIVISEHAQFMIHNSWTFAMGNAEELDKTGDRLRDIDDQMLAVYTKKTKLSRTEMKKYMDDETWFSAEKAKELGFVDRVDGDTVAIAASIVGHAKWLKQVPSALRTDQIVAKENMDKTQNRIKEYLARGKA